MKLSRKEVLKTFQSIYGVPDFVVRSPGRINLIGEHVDYNDGFVMPASINYETTFCIKEANDGLSEIYALKYNEYYSVDLSHPDRTVEPKWANYLLGVIRQFVDNGNNLKPFKCAFGGDIPMGAGLSSSASMECGFAYALNCLNELNLDKQSMIQSAQWAEHNYAGVKCGIMDQFAIMMGKKDQVIILDCRSLEHEYAPLNLSEHAIVLCDTRVKHSLVDSEYNKRREECEDALKVLNTRYRVNSFREVSEAMVLSLRSEMSRAVFNRASFIVGEIARVQGAKDDLKKNRLAEFGKKMFQTHTGLSKLYDVSCKELDFLVDEAKRFDGVVGARMMGGGFGGCTINLVKKDEVDKFIDSISCKYEKEFETKMPSHIVSIEAGTNAVKTQLKTII